MLKEMERQKMKDRVRMNLVLPSSTAERIRKLAERTEASNYAEVMKNALRLYEYILNESEKGEHVYIGKKDGELTEVRIFS